MKILILSWGIPPRTSGSAVIVGNLVEALGEDEYVLLGEEVEDVELSTKPNFKYLSSSGLKIKGNKYWRFFQLSPLIKEVTSIAKRTGCTHVLSIFPDEIYTYVGYRVSKKLNVPFHTWFHNTYLENRTGILKVLAKKWQKTFFAHSSTVFTMSDGITDLYRKKYGLEKFVTLTHGFNIPKINSFQEYNESGKLRFLYTGNVNHSCLDASIRLFNWITKNKLGTIDFYTGQSASELSELGISGEHVHVNGFITLEKLAEKFSNYDILLLPHGLKGLRSAEEYQTIFPTRTIPYLYAKRPILALSPENSFLTHFLRKNNCAHISTTGTEEELNILLEEIMNNKQIREDRIENALKASEIFDVNNVVTKFKKHLTAS